MKTMIILLSLIGSQAIATPARYSIPGKCFVLSSQGNQSFVQLGQITGVSGYDCNNAYDNLQSTCENRAKAKGFEGGSVYKDAFIEDQASGSSSSIEESARRGLLFLKGFSIGISQSESSSRSLRTVPVDINSDCRINTKYKQEEQETIQGDNYGS